MNAPGTPPPATSASTQRSVSPAQLRAALTAVASGQQELTRDGWAALLSAVDAMVTALANGPRPGEGDDQLGIWRNHERDPALAALADALMPLTPDAPTRPHSDAMSDAEARIALAAALRR